MPGQNSIASMISCDGGDGFSGGGATCRVSGHHPDYCTGNIFDGGKNGGDGEGSSPVGDAGQGTGKICQMAFFADGKSVLGKVDKDTFLQSLTLAFMEAEEEGYSLT